MRSYLRESNLMLRGDDPGCYACAWSPAMRTGEDQRSPVALARNLAPGLTGSGGDLTAIQSMRLLWENTAGHYLYRRAIPRVPCLYSVLLLPCRTCSSTGGVIQSRESGNGEAACRCRKTCVRLLFWNSSTRKVSLGMLMLLFWPCLEPIPVIHKSFEPNL